MEARGFEVSFQVDGTRAVVTCRGELDIATADKLWDAIDHVLKPQVASFHLDLGNVTFFGAQGVAILAHAKMRSDALGASFEVTTSDIVARVLDIVGFDELMQRSKDP